MATKTITTNETVEAKDNVDTNRRIRNRGQACKNDGGVEQRQENETVIDNQDLMKVSTSRNEAKHVVIGVERGV